jgi:hypothetical protein
MKISIQLVFIIAKAFLQAKKTQTTFVVYVISTIKFEGKNANTSLYQDFKDILKRRILQLK